MNKQTHTEIITNMLQTHIQHPIFKSIYSANLPLIRILHWVITNIGDYPKGLLVFFIENIWYSENEREEEAGYQSVNLKKNWSKWEHTKQYGKGRFSLFIHFCCGHCLHLPCLAGVYIGTVSCVCKSFSFFHSTRTQQYFAGALAEPQLEEQPSDKLGVPGPCEAHIWKPSIPNHPKSSSIYSGEPLSTAPTLAPSASCQSLG